MESYFSTNNIDIVNNLQTIEVTNLNFEGKEIDKVDKSVVQQRINAIMKFSELAVQIMPYILLDKRYTARLNTERREEAMLLNELFINARSIILPAVKNKYIKMITDTLPSQGSTPTISLNRLWIMHNKDKGRVDHNAEWTTFSSVMKGSKTNNYENLRVYNSNTKAWSCQMLGEGSIDAGGPYRDSVTNIAEELHSSCLPLLVPTQNNKNKHGLYMDCWTINPASTTATHLEMYKFMGALLGMAFRSGTVMDMKLTPLFWKKLAGEQITIEDLKLSDIYAVQTINTLAENKKEYPKETFEMAIDLTFTTPLSNGETVPICEGGENRRVLYEDVEEYNELVLKTRLNEGNLQMDKIKEGFDLIFPVGLISLLSWNDIETRVRGPDEISTAALKSITSYSCCDSENDYVKRFWRVFDAMSQPERSNFLKFVWGRSRLPPAERLRDQTFYIMLFSEGRFSDHDKQFPLAHTCSFTVDLPRYTTDEICREKILYASEACGQIDIDNTATDAGGVFD